MAAMDWDLTPYFPSFDGDAHRAFVSQLRADTASALARAQALGACDAGTSAAWAEIVVALEGLGQRWGHLESYLGALTAADAKHEGYRKHEGLLGRDVAAYRKLEVEVLRALRTVSDATFEAWLAMPQLAGASHALQRLRHRASKSMSPELEGLAADLASDGIDAWGRLYTAIAANLSFEMRWPDGRKDDVPMAQRRSLMRDADRAVREAAFRLGNEAWRAQQDTLAAALNHLAGVRHSLYARRGIDHVLDVALFDAAISKETLEAMFEAITAGAGVARRYLALKAKQDGRSQVAWFDLEAPLRMPGGPAPRLSWEDGVARLHDALRRSYPALDAFFERAVQSRWIDHAPRAGKQPGAFCTSSHLIDESRVFLTFQGSYGDLSTLAHEIGHAYHNAVMDGMRPLSREYPMTLAESASTFAEMLLADGLLGDPALELGQRARLLSESLNDAVAFLLDIPVRFEFERSFYEQRAHAAQSAAELCELMAQTQRRVLGDILDPDGTDPLFWASKLHFFITSVSFYNFPYSFGYLLSRGLFAAYKAEGPAFLPRYEAFLRRTGSGPAHLVARETLGVDLERPEFWSGAIASLDGVLDELVAITNA